MFRRTKPFIKAGLDDFDDLWVPPQGDDGVAAVITFCKEGLTPEEENAMETMGDTGIGSDTFNYEVSRWLQRAIPQVYRSRFGSPQPGTSLSEMAQKLSSL